jgi:C1A family cysteine protease
MPRYPLGWKRQSFDPRDWKYHVPRRVTAALPPSFDLTGSMGPLLDQADLGACGPHSAAECIDYDQKVEGLPVVVPSRLFIYWCVRDLMGTTDQDSGVDNRTMLKALNRRGFCPESLWAYDTSRFAERPPQACFDAALPNRITAYAAVAKQLDQMKGCLATGRPFIFGFDVFPSMMTDAVAASGVVPDPTPGETAEGGHDVTIVAYDDNGFGKVPGGAFKFRNHWRNGDGSWWGDQGCGYISYRYACGTHADDFWVIQSVPGAAPAPVPPGPAPVPDPGPAPLFLLSVARPVPAGGRVMFRARTAIPPGVYGWVPEGDKALVAVESE